MISHTEYVNTGGLYSKQGSGSIRRFVVLQIARQRKHKLKRRLEGFLPVATLQDKLYITIYPLVICYIAIENGHRNS